MASSKLNLDLNSIFLDAQAQFKGLNPNEPGQWPLLPKAAVFLVTTIAAVFVAWFSVISTTADELQAQRDKEPQLKEEYRSKLTQAINLDELRKQKAQVQEYVLQLEKQLPGKAEMDALLSDINQAGLGRGLQFELFRPSEASTKDYYAEQPINIRVIGRYHDIGDFAADIANLSRIVTLHNLNISYLNNKDLNGPLILETTARTYRYLDPAEIEAQRAAKAKNKKNAGGNP